MSITHNFLSITELKALGAQIRKEDKEIDELAKKYEDKMKEGVNPNEDKMMTKLHRLSKYVGSNEKTKYNHERAGKKAEEHLQKGITILRNYAGLTDKGLNKLRQTDVIAFFRSLMTSVKDDYVKNVDTIRQIAFTKNPRLSAEDFDDNLIDVEARI